jgi:hypothetical protein
MPLIQKTQAPPEGKRHPPGGLFHSLRISAIGEGEEISRIVFLLLVGETARRWAELCSFLYTISHICFLSYFSYTLGPVTLLRIHICCCRANSPERWQPVCPAACLVLAVSLNASNKRRRSKLHYICSVYKLLVRRYIFTSDPIDVTRLLKSLCPSVLTHVTARERRSCSSRQSVLGAGLLKFVDAFQFQQYSDINNGHFT